MLVVEWHQIEDHFCYSDLCGNRVPQSFTCAYIHVCSYHIRAQAD